MAKKKVAVQTPKKRAVETPAKTSRKPRTQTDELVLGDGVWPLERDILFRPDRLKYVRKLIKDEGCVFCKPAKQKPSYETLCVYQTKHSMVVMNKFPYNSGHLLILPRAHGGDMLKLSVEQWAGLTNLQRLAMRVVLEVYQPAGFNMGLNHGAVAGAGIPEHLHFHLIPRWSGDLNFFPLIAETKVVIENLETTYAKLAQGFQKLGATKDAK